MEPVKSPSTILGLQTWRLPNYVRLPEVTKYNRTLKTLGLSRDYMWADLWIVMSLVGGWALLTWLCVRVFNLVPVPWSQAFSVALSLGVAIVVYRQWRSARYEISIDKYYDRLEVVNKRLEGLNPNDKVHQYNLLLFAELDKLEYVIVKYQLGFIPPELTYRAIMNFQKACQDRDNGRFNTEAYRWVRTAAYTEQTRKVVEAICLEINPALFVSITPSADNRVKVDSPAE